MATDKYRKLALEVAQLPDDGLITVLAGEIELLEGQVTRDIQGTLAYAPNFKTAEETAALAPILIAFRNGPLDVQAQILEDAAVPALTAPLQIDVTDGSAVPIEDAEVLVCPSGVTGTTDALGRVTVLIAVGDYTVKAVDPGHTVSGFVDGTTDGSGLAITSLPLMDAYVPLACS